MANYKSVFQMVVEAADKTKGVLTNVQNNLKSAGKAGKAAASPISGAWMQVTAGIIAARAAIAAVEKAFQALQAGKQAAIVSTAFKSLHADSQQVLQTLRETASFAVDDTSLQMMANRWTASGKDLAELQRVMPVAYKIAAATGKDYLQVTQEVATALAAGRKRSLEAYAGLIDETKAYEAHARILNVTVKELTSLDKKRAIAAEGLNLLQERYGKIRIDLDAQKLNEVETRFKNIVSDLSEGLMRGVVGVVDALEDVREGRAMNRRYNESARRQLSTDEAATMVRRAADARAEMRQLAESQADDLHLINQTIHRTEALVELFGRIGNETDKTAQGTTAIDELMRGMLATGQITEQTYERAVALMDRAREQGMTANEVLLILRDTVKEYDKGIKAAADSQKKAQIEAAERARLAEIDRIAAIDAEKAARIKAMDEQVKLLEDYGSKVESLNALELKARTDLNQVDAARLVLLREQVKQLEESGKLSAQTVEQVRLAAVGDGADALVANLAAMKSAIADMRASAFKNASGRSTGGGGGGLTGSLTAAELRRMQLAEMKDTIDAEAEIIEQAEIEKLELRAQYRGKALEQQLAHLETMTAIEVRAAREQVETAEIEKQFAWEKTQAQFEAQVFELSTKRTETERLASQERLDLLDLEQRDDLGKVEDFELAKFQIQELYRLKRERSEADAREREEAERKESLDEQRRLYADFTRSMQDRQIAAIEQSASTAQRFAEQTNSYVGTLLAIGATTGSQIQQTMIQMDRERESIRASQMSEVDKITAIKQVESDAYWTAADAAVGAAAASVKSERVKAAIYGAMEVAKAAASYPDYMGMAMHGAAAAAYFAIAMSSGGGKSKPKTVYRAPRAATATSADRGGGPEIHYHIQGIMAGTGREFARETARLLNVN
jgi:hypothetical protein